MPSVLLLWRLSPWLPSNHRTGWLLHLHDRHCCCVSPSSPASRAAARGSRGSKGLRVRHRGWCCACHRREAKKRRLSNRLAAALLGRAVLGMSARCRVRGTHSSHFGGGRAGRRRTVQRARLLRPNGSELRVVKETSLQAGEREKRAGACPAIRREDRHRGGWRGCCGWLAGARCNEPMPRARDALERRPMMSARGSRKR